jgi:hypothetical protein
MMSAVPLHDLDQVATKRDLAEMRAGLTSEMAILRADVTGQILQLGESLNQRMDRVFYGMIASLLGVLAAMTAIVVEL